MSKKIVTAVISRQLPGEDYAIHAVLTGEHIETPIYSAEKTAIMGAKMRIRIFCEKLVEFKQATWKIVVMKPNTENEYLHYETLTYNDL